MLKGKPVTIEAVRDELTAVEERYKAERGPLRALLKVLLAQEPDEELVGAEGVEGLDDVAVDDEK